MVVAGVIVLAAIAGAATVSQTNLAVALAGALALVIIGLACANERGITFLGLALVAATFVNRFKFAAAGAHLRAEDLIVLSLLISLLLRDREREQLDRGDGPSLASVASHPASLFLLAYVVWGLVASYFFSPQFGPSFRIDIWLALDWLIMVTLVSAFASSGAMFRTGWHFGVAAFVIADILYVIGPKIHFGTQLAQGALSTTNSTYGLSYESNILGSTAAVWLLLALSHQGLSLRRRGYGDVSWLALLATTGALVLSFTRAAIVGIAAGLLVWGVIDGGPARQRILRRVVPAVLIPVAFLALVPSLGGPVFHKFAHLLTLSSGTGAERLVTVSNALPDLRHLNWVFGLGINSYGMRHEVSVVLGQSSTGYLGAFPLEVVYDTGAVGLMLLSGAWLSLRPWRSAQPGRAVGATVVFLVCSLTTSPFWLGCSWLLIALALAADLQRDSADNAQHYPGKHESLVASTSPQPLDTQS
jgi:hypothetical protein